MDFTRITKYLENFWVGDNHGNSICSFIFSQNKLLCPIFSLADTISIQIFFLENNPHNQSYNHSNDDRHSDDAYSFREEA